VHETLIHLEVAASFTYFVTLTQIRDAVISTFQLTTSFYPVAILDTAITQHKALVDATSLII
jgi:hypothetical protein